MDVVRVLIVDDDDVARKTLARLLSKAGHRVSVAKSGSSALSMLFEREFDLVLTDLVMEDVDGLDVLAKTRERYPDTEVIVITGYASIPSAIEAVKRGAYHYLEKPFRTDEVRHLVQHALEKRQVRHLENQMKARPSEPILIGQSRHGGDILVESEVGKGTTFTVLLPVAMVPAEIGNCSGSTS